MFGLVARLAKDEAGFVLSAELILIATVMTLAMVVGLGEVAGAVNHEMTDMSQAVEGMSQDYWYAAPAPPVSFDHVGR